MKPTWTSLRPEAISASMIRRQASLVGASGFSQNTGLPAPIAATTCSSWAGAPGRDEHRVDACVRDEIGGRRVYCRAGQARRDLPGAGCVDVVDGHDGLRR